jgi:hypothetical protein
MPRRKPTPKVPKRIYGLTERQILDEMGSCTDAERMEKLTAWLTELYRRQGKEMPAE